MEAKQINKTYSNNDAKSSKHNQSMRTKEILLQPLYRYPKNYLNEQINQPSGNNYINNDYYVIQRLVSSSAEVEHFHSNHCLVGNQNLQTHDNENHEGMLGDVEVTLEEYTGPYRDTFNEGVRISGTCLWRRVAVRGAGGSFLHKSFALSSSCNDAFSSSNMSSHFQKNNDHIIASLREMEDDIINDSVYSHPVMCWTSFAPEIDHQHNARAARLGQSSFFKRYLCVLAEPSLLRIFDMQPSSFNQPNEQTTKPDQRIFATEGGEGHVISLPFEASSIFSIHTSHYCEHENHKSSIEGLLIQRIGTQEDHAAWKDFQNTYDPNIHDIRYQDESSHAFERQFQYHHKQHSLFTKTQHYYHHHQEQHSHQIDEKINEDDDEECIISDPPHPVRLKNVFGPDVSAQTKQIHGVQSVSQLLYCENENINAQIQYHPSSVTSLFSLRHPLDEVRPLALLPPHFSTQNILSSLSSSSIPYPSHLPNNQYVQPLFSDAHEQVLFIGCPKRIHSINLSNKSVVTNSPNICVTFHTEIKRHAVWLLKRAPPPPVSTPLWKRATSGNVMKKGARNKFQSNQHVTLDENEKETFMSNTTPISATTTAPPQMETSFLRNDEKLMEDDVPGHLRQTSHLFSDIHPDYGLSLLWAEEPSVTTSRNHESFSFDRNETSQATLPLLPSAFQSESKSTVISLERAHHVFLASDMNKSVMNLCLVCPQKKNNQGSQIHGNQTESKSSNSSILRCLSIQINDEKAKCDESEHCGAIIHRISHKMDMPCISAQPISAIPNIIDILVCVASTNHSQSEEHSLKLYRGDYYISDFCLPLGGCFGWDNSGEKEFKVKNTFPGKVTGRSFLSTVSEKKKDTRSLSEMNEHKIIVNLSCPIRDRIDITCKTPTLPALATESTKDETLKKWDEKMKCFTIRTSISLSMTTSPLAEAALQAIDSASNIPSEFSLQLRVDCVRFFQQISLLSSVDQNAVYTFVDPGWTAVSTIILEIVRKLFTYRDDSSSTNLKKDIIGSKSYERNVRGNITNRKNADYELDLLLQSEFHNTYSIDHSDLFFECKNFKPSSIENKNEKVNTSKSSPTNEVESKFIEMLSDLTCTSIHNIPITQELCSCLFDALHLLYEDAKLCKSSRGKDWIDRLGTLMIQITKRSNGKMDDFLDHYRRDVCSKCESCFVLSPHLEFEHSYRLSTFETPPSFFAWIDFMLKGYTMDDAWTETAYFKISPQILNGSCLSTKKIYRLFSILLDPNNTDPGMSVSKPSSKNDNKETTSSGDQYVKERSQRVVLAMVDEGLTNLSDIVKELPTAIILPLMESVNRCRNDPPRFNSNWPPKAYELIGRSDLAEMIYIKQGLKEPPKFSSLSARYKGSRVDSLLSPSRGLLTLHSDPEEDGLVPIEIFSSMIFPHDRRIREAARCLQSSRPTFFRVDRALDISDHDYERLKQERLLLLCRRVLACPLGRGMLTIGSMQPVLAEPLPIPHLCLAGKVPPNNAILALDVSSCPPDMCMWPEFHNGVAAGLRMRMERSSNIKGGINQITRTWILFNKPNSQRTGGQESQTHSVSNPNSSNRSSASSYHAHGGLLMALGLRGHLSALAMTDIYEYLTQGGVTTTVGILLGMAATKRSTCDPSVSKMLCLHIPSLLPPSFSTMEVASAAQAAAIAGIGLLYQGSSHRLMTEFLLNEMGKKPTTDYSTHDRESYTLACGLALGLVNLGTGKSDDGNQKHGMGAGLADLNIEERLHRYIIGGNDTAGARLRMEAIGKSNVGGLNVDTDKCSRIFEGIAINTDVTAPGATLALGLMYLKSNNKPVASSIKLPDTHFLLDNVRPDLLMLRVISRALILWDDVKPSSYWIDEQIPVVIKNSYEQLKRQGSKSSDYINLFNNTNENNDKEQSSIDGTYVDRQLIRQLHSHIVAGACFALGLRYAGTGNASAAASISERVRVFCKLRDASDAVSLAQRPERPILEMCLGCAAISLAMVMAGTGDIASMRLFREIRWRCDDEVSHGNHMVFGACIGLLFLGGGSCTLGREPADIGVLLMAFFPRFPCHASDNQYHLQALRHCYVLATRNRELEAVDVDTREPVYVPMEIQFRNNRQSKFTTTPCLLPHFDDISHIRINSKRYFPLTIDLNSLNIRKKENNHSSFPIIVKKKPGVLSYAQDPHLSRSLLVQSGMSKSGSALELIELFTDDPMLLAFAQYICNKVDEEEFESFCMSVLHECLTEGKIDAIPLFLSLKTSILSLKKEANSATSIVWDVKLIGSYYDWLDTIYGVNKPYTRLLSSDYVAILKESVDQILVNHGLDEALIKYYQKFGEWADTGNEKGFSGSFLVWYGL